MTEKIMNEHTTSQLKVLREISAICEKLKIKFWLRGGWAIDFLLGRITRPHDDIDLITWIQHRELLETALKNAGFEQISVKEQFRNRQSDFCKDNVEVTFGYITYSIDGSIIMNGLPEWIWQADSLLPHRFLLNGITASVINPKQLLEEKEVYERIGRIPRLKDVESKKILNRILSDINKRYIFGGE